MKRPLVFIYACFASQLLFAQFNEWTWLKGSSTAGGTAVFGTQGQANIANTPGTSYEAIEWTDKNGILWLLNGTTFWKYDPGTNMWTWMRTSNVVWGVQGVPSVNNFPGGHGFTALTWVDKNNDLWLYAGAPGGWDDNLWRYNITTQEWTWMKGVGQCTCTPRVYGVKGVSASSNDPGPRAEVSCSWVDPTGNQLWFFGGQACTGTCNSGSTNMGLSDVWRYDIGTNNWTWMSGPTTSGAAGVYGVKGVASGANTPGGRFVYASGGNQATGDFLVFGGNSDYMNATELSDTWRYNYITDQWTWLAGPNTKNQVATFGTKCVPSVSNTPSSGREVRTRWSDDCGNLWVFSTGAIGTRDNSLWRFSAKNSTWTWVSGPGTLNQNGVYGVQGVSAPTNIPGTRNGGNAWRVGNDLFMFGGGGYASSGASTGLNDLWRYRADKPVASFTVGSSSGCAPVNVSFTNNSTPGCNEIKSYLWNFGGGAADTSTLINPTHTFVNNGTFTVKLVVINCTGSMDSTTQTVNIGAGVTANVNQTGTSCFGGSNGTASASLSGGTSPYTYSWSSGQTTQNVTGLSSGVYTVVVTDNTGCSTSKTVNITQPSTINPQTSSIGASCGQSNGTASVTASGGTGAFTYSWNPGGQATATATGLSAGTYTITVTDNNGCTSTASVNIANSSSGNVSISASSNPNCFGQTTGTATASISGGTSPYTYSWNNAQTNQQATGLGAGTYTVTITDANGCSGTQTVSITQPTQVAAAVSSSSTLCSGSTGTASVTASGGSGSFTYNWNPSGQTAATATGLSAGSYVVTVTDQNGCTQTANVSVTSAGSMTVNLTSSTNPLCGGQNTGSATMSAATGTAPYTYSWSGGGGTNATATGLAAGTYTLTVTDANGCQNTQTVTITQPAAITATAAATAASCGASDGTASVTSGGGTGSFTYSWSNGGTTSSLTGLSTGNYIVLITDGNGCTQTAQTNVGQNGGPTATATATATIIQAGQSSTLNSTGGGTYTWSPSTGLSCTNCQSPTASPAVTTDYCVTVTDNNGCTATACITIVVETPCPLAENFAVPSAFSPNGDGHNDIFFLQGWQDCVQQFSLTIYDRWGERVFESSDPAKGWDGNLDGRPMGTAVFAYYISATNNKGEPFIKKGNISLLR